MIEDKLMQMGVLGLWTTSLIMEKLTTHKQMMSLLREIRNLLRGKKRL